LFLHIVLSAQAQEKRNQVFGTPLKNAKTIPALQNGNSTIATSYTATACGLNWVQGSVVLEQKSDSAGLTSPPMGSVQPAVISISGIPIGATIVKAFLYADASGNGIAVNASLTNPASVNAIVPMTIIGQDVDKCWSSLGYSASYSYRADVTSSISGNGNYLLSGMPVFPSSLGPNDIDGATLFIVYSISGANYTGSIVLADGEMVSIGSGVSGSINGFNACAASTNGDAFMILSDLQGIAQSNIILGNTSTSLPAATDSWWNFVQATTTITAGQSNASYSISNSGDCFALALAGLYFQTTCNTCGPCPDTTCISNSSSISICQGTSTLLAVNGATSCIWSANAGSVTTNTVSVSPSVTTTYSVAAIAANGDTAKRNITITVLNGITISGPSAVCVGNAATLIASGASTYTWSNGSNANSITVSPTVTTVYSVTSGTGTCTSATQTVLVDSPSTPQICMVSTDSLSKYNFVVWDKTQVPTADSVIVYREVSTNIYKRIGATSKDSLSQFIDTSRNVTPANGDPNIGTYRYKLQVLDTCGSYGPMGLYHNTVHITDLHTGSFTWNSYAIESMPSTPVLNYNLMRDDNNTGVWHQVGSVAGTQTTIADPNYATYQSTANWRVEAAFGYVCTPTFRNNNTAQNAAVNSLSNFVNSFSTEIKKQFLNSKMVIYPNPSSGIINIELQGLYEIKIISITDLLGNEIMSEVLKNGNGYLQMNLSNITNGIYFINAGSIHERIVKE
jgi:hypothetical protein